MIYYLVLLGNVASPIKNPKQYVRIIHRYHFTSSLKRMSTIVSLDHAKEPTIWVLCKGAPEKLVEFLDKEKVFFFSILQNIYFILNNRFL